MLNNKINFVNRLRFYTRIHQAIKKLTSVDYSIITGGFVQNSIKSGDVDIVTVIPCQFNFTQKEIVDLAVENVSAQQDNGFFPDFQFPIDVVLRHQMIDAINGRAFFVDNDKLKIKKYSDEEISENSEADYLIWLYEMITHDFDIICGNFEMLVEDTLRALQTTFLYVVSEYEYGECVEISQLSKDIFSVVDLNYQLSEKQCRYLLLMIEDNQYGKMDKNGLIHLDYDVLDKDFEILKRSVFSGEFNSATHCIEWSILRDACAEKM